MLSEALLCSLWLLGLADICYTDNFKFEANPMMSQELNFHGLSYESISYSPQV